MAPISRSCTCSRRSRSTTSASACGSRRCGSTTTRSVRRSRASATSARTASPMRRSTNPASTDGGRWPMPSRDVAIVSFAQSDHVRAVTDANEVEMLMPVTSAAVAGAGLTNKDMGFTCSGSTDYLAGTAFSFVSTLDGVGPWPPIQESHVEMDGAWALYEAWVKLQIGEIDTALVYAYAKSSPGDLPMVLTRQLDTIMVGPLWPDAVSLAALQARALIDAGKATEADFAEVAARS